MKVAIAGNLIVDTIKMIETYPQKNMLATVSSLSKSVGGCVPNVAIDLKTLSPATEIAAYGRVGEDDNGNFLRETLARAGVDVSHILTDAAQTSFTDVMTERGGARTFFQYRGANAAFSEADLDPEHLDADLLHIGYALLLDALDEEDARYGTKMARLLCNVRGRGIKTSLDVVSEASDRFARIVSPAVPYCDLIVVNESEGGMITGVDPRRSDGSIDLSALERILRGFLRLGVKEKIVVHCPEVGVSMRPGGKMCVVPSLALPKGYIKGTVGAGDAFCAGILYATLYGKSDEEALRIASCTAAANLSAPDSVSGAALLDEVMKFEQFGRIVL